MVVVLATGLTYSLTSVFFLVCVIFQVASCDWVVWISKSKLHGTICEVDLQIAAALLQLRDILMAP